MKEELNYSEDTKPFASPEACGIKSDISCTYFQGDLLSVHDDFKMSTKLIDEKNCNIKEEYIEIEVNEHDIKQESCKVKQEINTEEEKTYETTAQDYFYDTLSKTQAAPLKFEKSCAVVLDRLPFVCEHDYLLCTSLHCYTVFYNLKNLAVHLLKHENSISSAKSLSNNKKPLRRNLSNKSVKLKCNFCSRSWKSKSELNRHLRTHTGEKPFKCNICNTSFTRESYLRRHLRTHTDEKPFKCDVCSKFFRRNSHLTEHSRVHSGEKPFKCNFCTKPFSLKSTLIRHLRLHSSRKTYVCDICYKSFVCHSSLTEHLMTHSDEKPYKCDFCSKSFGRFSYLANHLSLHSETR